MSFFFFLLPVTLTRTASNMLNIKVRTDILIVFLTIAVKQSLIMKLPINCRFFVNALYQVEEVPVCAYFFAFFLRAVYLGII